MNNIYDEANEKTKAIFPGYNEDKINKNYKNARKFPPFLMVRAGVYNSLIIPLIGAWVFAAAAKPIPTDLSDDMQFVGGLVGLVTFVFGVLYSAEKIGFCRARVEAYSEHISKVLTQYAKTGQYKNDLSNPTNLFNKIEPVIIKHMAKNDARLFNNMLKNPESIKDATIATNIVAGHLKSHPEDATQVESVFDINTMPKQLQKRIMRILIARSK